MFSLSAISSVEIICEVFCNKLRIMLCQKAGQSVVSHQNRNTTFKFRKLFLNNIRIEIREKVNITENVKQRVRVSRSKQCVKNNNHKIKLNNYIRIYWTIYLIYSSSHLQHKSDSESPRPYKDVFMVEF